MRAGWSNDAERGRSSVSGGRGGRQRLRRQPPPTQAMRKNRLVPAVLTFCSSLFMVPTLCTGPGACSVGGHVLRLGAPPSGRACMCCDAGARLLIAGSLTPDPLQMSAGLVGCVNAAQNLAAGGEVHGSQNGGSQRWLSRPSRPVQYSGALHPRCIDVLMRSRHATSAPQPCSFTRAPAPATARRTCPLADEIGRHGRRLHMQARAHA